MVTALVLLNVSREKVNAVAESLADMEGISEVYSIAGQETAARWPLRRTFFSLRALLSAVTRQKAQKS